MQSLMPPIDSSDNLFHDGNPLTGEKGTIVTAEFLNAVQSAIRDSQSELIAILTAANIVPDSATPGQVLSAIKRILLASNNNYFVDTGVANSIVISAAPAMTKLTDGQVFDIACAAANTGAVTLKINNLNAFPVVSMAGALQGGEIASAKGVIRVIWSASSNSFLLLSINAGGAFPTGIATQNNHAVPLSQIVNRITPEFAPLLWYSNTPPTGYIAWWGQAITQAQYPKLYAIFGANLPDSRNQFLRFSADARQALSKQDGSSISPYVGNMTNNEMGVFINNGDASGLVASNFQRYTTNSPSSAVGSTYVKLRPDNIALTLISKAG